MHETEPFNDVTPPCPDCGETAIPCACGKPIETVAQLQRALEAAGASLRVVADSRGGWVATMVRDSFGAVGTGATLAEAIESAIDAWWAR